MNCLSRTPFAKGDLNFNTLIYSLVAPVKARLEKYRTPEACGNWNSTLIEDLRSDPALTHSADKLNNAAVRSQFEETPVMDGTGSICSVDIQVGQRLTIRFALSFLSPKYFVAPAEFTLIRDNVDTGIYIAEYSCGIRDPNGEFSTTSERHCQFPSDKSQWVVSHTQKFGAQGLKDWIGCDGDDVR